jgi:hypothetical protein
MADGWQHKREVRGGVGDWRLREEESGSWGDEDLQPVRSAYQPPASSTFLSERISHQQPATTSQQYSSLRTNQHQPSATSQPNRPLDCGVWRGRRVSFVGCYWAKILKFSWAIIQIRYCSVNSVYRGTKPNLPWFFRYLNLRTEHEPIIFDSVFFGSVLDPRYFMPSSSCTYRRIDSMRFVTPRRALVFNN